MRLRVGEAYEPSRIRYALATVHVASAQSVDQVGQTRRVGSIFACVKTQIMHVMLRSRSQADFCISSRLLSTPGTVYPTLAMISK